MAGWYRRWAGNDTDGPLLRLWPVTDLDHPGVRFHAGDGRHLADAASADDLASWPRPWLVIDDADHAEPTTSGILSFFHPHLLPGDMMLVEDGNLS
jgi:cephalosporin hydroxylase